MSRSSQKFLLVLLATGLSACDRQPVEVPTPAASAPSDVLASAAPTQGALLARIRAATARYHRVEVAEADGYELLELPPHLFPDDCVPGEGIRYVRFDLYFDGAVDPTQPEQLLYERLPSGKLRLAGVQFLVPSATWDPFHSERPYLGTQPFMDRRLPPWGAPFPNYALFVWLWTHNPDGMYTQRNPRVPC